MIKKQKIFIALLVMSFFIIFAPHVLALAGGFHGGGTIRVVEVSMEGLEAFTLVITHHQVWKVVYQIK